MKTFPVIFVVQADTVEDAERQATAYLRLACSVVQGPTHLPITRPPFMIVRGSSDPAVEAAPYLPMVPCKGCGKNLVDDGWVRFCSEECDDGSR